MKTGQNAGGYAATQVNPPGGQSLKGQVAGLCPQYGSKGFQGYLTEAAGRLVIQGGVDDERCPVLCSGQLFTEPGRFVKVAAGFEKIINFRIGYFWDYPDYWIC